MSATIELPEIDPAISAMTRDELVMHIGGLQEQIRSLESQVSSLEPLAKIGRCAQTCANEIASDIEDDYEDSDRLYNEFADISVADWAPEFVTLPDGRVARLQRVTYLIEE